jgi:hypothetical protein
MCHLVDAALLGLGPWNFENMDYPDKVRKFEDDNYLARHPDWIPGTARFMSLAELQDPPRPRHGDTWGGAWRFNRKNLTLEAICSGYDYEVDLERIKTKAEAVHWIGHLQTKVWGQGANLGHFIEALSDVAGLTGDQWHTEFNVCDRVRKTYRPKRKRPDRAA